MRIAFIGLGRMGAGMARNLLRAGHSVAVFNRTHSKAQALVADGARVTSSIRDACGGVQVCWTMLADDPAVQNAVFARDGIADSLPPGATHVSSSTITIAMSRVLANEHGTRQQGYLSVPVFGRPDAAESKTLIAVAAGQPDLVEQTRSLLEAVSRALFIAGPEPWQANLFKLCGNFTIASMIETMGEAFATLRKAGTDHQVFFDILNELYRSPVYKNYGSTIVSEKFQPAGFALKLGLKDIRQVLEAADEFNTPMPFASVVRDQLLSALANGQEALDWSCFALTAARHAGL